MQLTDFMRAAASRLEALTFRYLQLPNDGRAVAALGTSVLLLRQLRELHIQEGWSDALGSSFWIGAARWAPNRVKLGVKRFQQKDTQSLK